MPVRGKPGDINNNERLAKGEPAENIKRCQTKGEPAPMRMNSTSSSGRGFPSGTFVRGFHFVDDIFLKKIADQ